MKKLLTLLIACLMAGVASAGNILNEGFEYANHEYASPIGWICNDTSWRCGYLEKDHNRIPHTGNWYAFTDDDEAWMFMPVNLITSMHYRFKTWAITDGQYTLSFWAGTAPNREAMIHPLFSEDIDIHNYSQVSAYLQEIPEDCEYIGICGVKLQDGSFLTIDDIDIDMVEQYQFEASAVTGDTAMYPGTQALFRFIIRNTGYDPVSVTVHPSDEFFTDFSFYSEGLCATTFDLQPDEVAKVRVYATLRPEVEPGTVVWLDISMTIPCNCNTALVAFWVTPLETTQTHESHMPQISVYPNPATDHVTVEGEGIQQITLYDWTGRRVKCIPVENKQTRISLEGLKSGGYFIIADSEEGIIRRAIIKR